MSKIWITELSSVAVLAARHESVAAAQLTPVASQVVTFGASTQSAELNANTRFVRVRSDAACHIVVGMNPTATVDDAPLGANETEYFGVPPGYKIAVIAAA
jgi:hypothetical protein